MRRGALFRNLDIRSITIAFVSTKLYEQKITISQGKNVNNDTIVSCRKCKFETNHIIHSEIILDGCEDISREADFSWRDTFQIVQCKGCNTVSFKKIHINSEALDVDSHGEYYNYEEIDLYPNLESGRELVADYELLPSNIEKIYEETINSFNLNYRIITGMGIRAIVETVCKNQKAAGNDLYVQINSLVKMGVLTQAGADILHKLRILGNAAAHEAKPHEISQLNVALDVIDHLLTAVYILPHHVSRTRFE